MEKEVVRKSISFPKELEHNIAKRAKLGNRSFSAQVVYDMTQITEILIAHVKMKGKPPRNLSNEWPSPQESSIETEE